MPMTLQIRQHGGTAIPKQKTHIQYLEGCELSVMANRPLADSAIGQFMLNPLSATMSDAPLHTNLLGGPVIGRKHHANVCMRDASSR
jgi:hypothetical protein